ncbi:MAG: CDGSH iron-sulfur domain-containing protein [Bacteroidetes bacterium]|jgi:CDGSH-type Zn-finger protein|nr:CDGSH iron-sulfur domain-containing protein [Bacteroidota bacterium]
MAEKDIKENKEQEEESTLLTVRKNGPLRISGNFKLTESTGKVSYPEEMIAICRCGHSATMPFCDGAHKLVGFKG